MAGESTRDSNPAGHAGLLDNLVAFAHAFAEFFTARFRLFALESKTALIQLLILAGCIVGAAILALLGYIFLVASVVVGIASALGVSWVWVALGAASVHFLLAAICLLIAKMRLSLPMYQNMTFELKRDREWLQNLNQPSRSSR